GEHRGVTQMSMRERFRAIHPHRPRPAPPSPRHYLPKRRVPALIAGPLIVALVVGGLALGIKAAYGGFGHYYSLTVHLPRAAQVGPELEDAIADGVNVLDAIRPGDAATVVSTLAQAARGHGQDVARGLQANSDLAQLFASTLDPQLQALHDFDVVFGALKD